MLNIAFRIRKNVTITEIYGPSQPGMAARYSPFSSQSKPRTPTSVSASICRKYRRIRERPSPLSENVRRKLLIKATGGDLATQISGKTPAANPLQPQDQVASDSTVSAGQGNC